MNKFIFIAGINRSGGSLLARFFDGHEQVSSYPMEVGFKFKNDIFGFVDKVTGSPTYIPKFEKNIDFLKYFDAEKEEPIYKWGKERSEKMGVRKNYLEKGFYEVNIQTNFDYDNYVKKLNEYCKKSKNNQELFTNKHKAYFESWDYENKKIDTKVVVKHDSGGLFLNNFDKYFNDFRDSIVAVPIRDVVGYVAAEKTRIARRYFGSRRFAKPLPPNFLIKKFDQYDIEAIIRTWNVSLTRIRILQEKFGVNQKLVVYRFENLVKNPNKIIDYLCSKVELKPNSILYEPTLMGKPWLGNSQQGKNIGINKNPNNYAFRILRDEEIKLINLKTEGIMNKISSLNECPLNLMNIKENLFFDYKKHKEYSNDNNIWSLYCAFSFSGFRKLKLNSVSVLSIYAILFKSLVRIWHIPRLLKQKYFKGFGKQNYT